VTELPARKPKKRIPTKETVFLVLLSRSGEVLLEKRPPAGIWGGLWSFPETSKDEAENTLASMGLSGSETTYLDPGEHTFSHYRLRFYPLIVRGEQQGALKVEERDIHTWFNPSQPTELGLPAPVATLLQQLDFD